MTAIHRLGAKWEYVICKDIIDVRDGTHDSPAKVSAGIPLITSKNLKPEGISFEDVTYISEADYLKIEKRSGVDDGDVLFAMIGTIGNPVVVRKDRRFSIKNVALFKLKGSPVLPEFFKALLSAEIITTQIVRSVRGGSQKFVALNVLRNLLIPVPPLEHQRRIAQVLDQADSLRAKRRATLAQVDLLTQYIFFNLVGNATVPIHTIGDLLRSGGLLLHKDGNHGNLYPRDEDFGDEGIPFLSAKAISKDGYIDNVRIEKLRKEKAERLRIGWIQKGDVLLAHNASVGKVALYDGCFERALIGTSLTAFRPNPEALDSRYLTAALRSDRFQHELEKNMGQTTRNQVPITAQRDLKIPVPSITLQREFAHQDAAVQKLKAAQRASLAEMDALLGSLQYRAFHGHL